MKKAPSVLFALFILFGAARFLLWIPNALDIYDTMQPDWIGFVSAGLLICAIVSLLTQRNSDVVTMQPSHHVRPGDYLLLGLVVLFALAGIFISIVATAGEPQASIMKVTIILIAVGTLLASLGAFLRSMLP